MDQDKRQKPARRKPARKSKPSFSGDPRPADAPAGWVYRTDQPAGAAPEPEVTPGEVIAPGEIVTSGEVIASDVQPLSPAERDSRALEIVRRHAGYAAVAGLIPLPALDVAAIGGVELKMLSELAEVYEVPFEREQARAILAALIGGYTSTQIGYGLGASALKGFPGVGSLVGIFSVPACGAGLTWAVGRVFIQHFASGGTFLDFDPAKVRAHFASAPA